MLIPRRFPHTLPDEQSLLSDASSVSPDLLATWEAAIAALAGTKGAVALNSGRQGMTLILRFLGVGSGDEVIVPAFTLGALIPLVEGLGAKAVLADIDPDTLNVSVESVLARITERTKAIIVLHAFGAPAPVEEIVASTQARGIRVVEDCAHSLGARAQGRATGSFGDAGFYSFEITKPVNTYGGGMVVSDNLDLLEHIRTEVSALRPDSAGLEGKIKAARMERFLMQTNIAWPILFALAHPLTAGPLSALYRSRQTVPSSAAAYSPAQARMGLRKLESLESRIAWRARLAGIYRSLLHSDIRMQQVAQGTTSTWYFLVVTLPVPAEEIRLYLLTRGIDSAIGEEVADDVATPLGYSDCPVAHRIQHQVMALPLFDSMTEAQVRRVCAVVNAALARSKSTA